MTKRSKAAFSRGDVVYVPIGFTSLAGGKLRPAVVVSDDHYNRTTPDLIVASVTSNLQAVRHPGDHLIADWRGAGLRAPSLLQAKLTTVAQPVVRRKIGRLGGPDLAALDAGLRRALGLRGGEL